MTETELKMKKDTNYLIVKTYSAYAVALDSSGRFIKTANPGYEVGDITDKIIPLIYPQDKKRRRNTVIRLAAGLAACICLCAFGIYEYQYMFIEYGSLRMQINPEVEISLSRSGRVLDIEGENADGRDLLENYSYKGKDKETVVDELTDLAIEQNYLADGGRIAISADSRSDAWSERIEAEILEELNRHLKDQGIAVEITIGPMEPADEKETLQVPQSVTIPIPQIPEPTPEQTPDPGSDYEPDGNGGSADTASPSAPASALPSQPPAASQPDSGYGGGDSSYDSDISYDSDDDSSYNSNGDDSSYDDND